MAHYDYPESELEDSLRRAFVDHGADYIVLDSRRQRFLMQSAALGEARGWLKGELLQLDEQSSEARFRLTPEGHAHFGTGGQR